jgi:hypothetical protein
VGVSSLAVGYLLALGPLAAIGLLAASTGALMLLANVLRTARAPGRPLGVPAALVLAGQLCLGVGLALAASLAPLDASRPFTGGVRGGLAALLVAGWVGLTVAGSLLHLIPVSAQRRPAPLPWPLALASAPRAIAALAAGGVALLATAQMAGWSAAAVAAHVVLGVCVLALGTAILRLATPSRSRMRARAGSAP